MNVSETSSPAQIAASLNAFEVEVLAPVHRWEVAFS